MLEPGTTYIHGWHIDAICAHLEAVTRGDINRLLINIPPGFMKSLLVSVLWPAWEWTQRPALSYLSTAYKDEISTRDTRKMRDLVLSDWYTSLWPHVILQRTAETSFANDARGSRESMAFTQLTGGRADRLIIDDPHSTEQAESEADRNRAIRVFRESVPSRVNDPEKSAIIIIMQRLHENDVAGQVLKLKLPYVHLRLPMEFEADNSCHTSVGFRDPRSYESELLFPERFSRPTVDKLKSTLGSYAVACQFQQRPAPREGGMFKRHWFEIVRAAPAGGRYVRAWDRAGTKGGGDFTAGVLMKAVGGVYYIIDVIRFQGSPAEVDKAIKNAAAMDDAVYGNVKVRLPQDPGQAGKAQAASDAVLIAGRTFRTVPVTGSKEVRANPLASQAEAGNIKLMAAQWNETFIDELCSFPSAAHDDQVDAAADAFAELLDAGSETGWLEFAAAQLKAKKDAAANQGA